MIKLIKSSFYDEETTKRNLADFLLGAKTLSMGTKCREFEILFSDKQQRIFSVYVSSGSAANLVLLQALLNLGRLKKGDRVGFSALTWATNVMPIIQLGLVPVAIDCELATLNVSSKTLAPHLSTLQALFITNVLGFCDDIDVIAKHCKEKGVILLEDNCEALGSKAFGTLLGNFGIASTFSFFVGHHLSTIEGGMVCTDDEALYEMLIMVRAHGWDRDLPESAKQRLRTEYSINEFYAKYTFYDLAYNARPTEINGYLGTIQLPFWDTIVTARENNYKLCAALIEKNPDCIPLVLAHMDIISNFATPFICKNEQQVVEYGRRFAEAGVEIRPIIAGDITKQPFYKKYCSTPEHCPNAGIIHTCGFYFPNNPELDEDDMQTIKKLL